MTFRPTHVACLGVASALCLGVLAGCDDDDSGESSTVTETVTTEETESSGQTDAAEDTQTAGKASNAAGQAGGVAAASVRRGPHYFETPSSNIGCYVNRRAARCDIRERNWDPPSHDVECDVDYGQGIALDTKGRGAFVCAGDTVLGGPATLPYGAVSRRGDIRCRSGRKGMTCIVVTSGHGFFLSRESYRIF